MTNPTPNGGQLNRNKQRHTITRWPTLRSVAGVRQSAARRLNCLLVDNPQSLVPVTFHLRPFRPPPRLHPEAACPLASPRGTSRTDPGWLPPRPPPPRPTPPTRGR